MAFRSITVVGLLSLLGATLVLAPSCSNEEGPPPLDPGNKNTGGGNSQSVGSGGGTGGTGGGTGGGTPAQCTDGTKNGNETATDCGGMACDPCGESANCEADEDCKSRNCDGAAPGVVGICAEASCSDGQLDGNETDIDCGSSTKPAWSNTPCGPCDDQKKCNANTDCKSGSCSGPGGKCTPVGCGNSAKDNGETDVDCGGPCIGCADGKVCTKKDDCLSKNCVGGSCAPANCNNLAQDGDETGIDCGGATHLSGTNPACPPCADYKGCEVAKDCLSQICDTNTDLCAPPSCADGIKNGTETGTDCGGSCMKKCPDLGGCNADIDCQSTICLGGICQVPKCNDQKKNGDETDIDCGGMTCTPCRAGQKCVAGNDCTTSNCSMNTCACPPGMSIVPVFGGGGAYCIDTTEVTNDQYMAFYFANPSTANQPATCSWNQSYAPQGNWPPFPANPGDGSSLEPVTFVDWCDAYAYCAHVGKHLCGKVGIGGGPNPPADFTDFQKSEWYNACSNQGATLYPYGNVFAEHCNTKANPPETDNLSGLANINDAQYPFCLGGAPNLRHMSGNAAEWEDSCTASNGPNDGCQVRGGSKDAVNPSQSRCDANDARPRNYTGGDVGFRCCL